MTRLVAILAGVASSMAGEIPDQWVWALGEIETGNRSVTGDRSKAAGPHQFHSAAWRQVSEERKRNHQHIFPYKLAYDAEVSAWYAKTWMLMLATRLAKDTGRWPRPAEVFLAHNLGYEGFRKIGFQVGNAPAKRYDAALRFETLALSKSK